MPLIVCRFIVVENIKLNERERLCYMRKIRIRKQELLVQFGSRLRAMRISKALSQEQLADRAGLHRNYVGSVERGERNISLINIQRLALALGCRISELLPE